jgi:hypothetical protein
LLSDAVAVALALQLTGATVRFAWRLCTCHAALCGQATWALGGGGGLKPTAVLVHRSGATGPTGPKGDKGEKGDTGACSPIAHLHILTKAAHRHCTSSTCITRWLVAHDSRGQ